MATRITEKFLDAVVTRVNRATDSPLAPYEVIDGNHAACIGNYHIDHAYGGVALHRMVTSGGGVSDVFNCGHVTKRELCDRIFAFLAGIEAAKDAK